MTKEPEEHEMSTTARRGRKATPPPGPELELDGMFRPDSKAMQAAKMLLSGQQVSRTEIAETLEVSPTTIPRVVGKLEAAGVQIERSHGGPSDKEVFYRATAVKGATRPEGQTIETKVLGDVVLKASRIEMDGDVVAVWIDSPLGKVAAKSTPGASLATFATTGLPLSRVFLLPDCKQSWVVGTGSETLVLTDLEFET